jgi:hypothetical protein
MANEFCKFYFLFYFWFVEDRFYALASGNEFLLFPLFHFLSCLHVGLSTTSTLWPLSAFSSSYTWLLLLLPLSELN